MNIKQVIVNLHNGEVEIEAVGFKGNACEKATKLIEDALSGKRISQTKKPEYTSLSTVAQTQKVGAK